MNSEYQLFVYVLWLISPAVLGIAIYWFLTKNHSYWKQRNVPSAPTLPLVGTIFKSFSKPMHETELERYMKYGRIYGTYEGSRPVINVGEPEHVRNILVKDFQFFTNRRSLFTGDPVGDNMVNVVEGEAWKRLRTIITPTFTTGKIKRMFKIFEDCAKALAQNFLIAAKEKKSFDAKRFFGAYSMDVIASSAFSTKIDSHNDPNNEFVITARNLFSRNFNWRAVALFLFPSWMTLFRIPVFQPTAVAFFKRVTLQIMEERKRTGQTRNDFLQLLMDTAKEEIVKEEAEEKESDDSKSANEDQSEIFKQYIQKKTLSFDELVAQCVIFFLAGYDTTASTLSFVAYNLALNTDVQERLIKEIDEAVKEAEGHITHEAIQKMKFLDNVISETLRMFPPAIRLERRAGIDYKLGDTGITIPKGMIVSIPNYCMQRDPEFFPEPNKFDPDRFTAEAKSTRDPYTYLPFGAGPRNCLGMRFALMEAKVCLVYVLSHFRIKKSPETKDKLDYFVGSVLLQPKSIPIMVEKREDSLLKL